MTVCQTRSRYPLGMEFTYQQAVGLDDKAVVRKLVIDSTQPQGLDAFENLRSLSLGGNSAVTSFSFLKTLPKLEALYLSNMGLAEIPAEVGTLKELQTLFLGSNPIKDLSLLSQLPRLVEINLEEMSLRKIPDEVLAVNGLKILGLYGNSITSISSLKKLPKLEELYIANNKIKKVPKEITKLGNLRLLDIMHNRLTDSAAIAKVEQLEELSMTNVFSPFPAGIFGLRNLRSLTLSANKVGTEIPGFEDIGALENLEELTIHRCCPSALPTGFGMLKKLRKLEIQAAEHLEDVSALGGLPALEELQLTSCGIVTLGEFLSTLKSLAKLDISHNNKLADISGLRDLPELRELKAYTKLEAIPSSMASLTALTKLELSANGAKVDFLGQFERLEELYIANCDIAEFSATMTGLRKLTIHTKAQDLSIPSYPNLQELQVTAPSYTLTSFPRLESLSVGGIEKSLDLKAISTLTALRKLFIHRSETLASIPKEVATAATLEELKLSFLSALREIDGLRGLPALRKLEFYAVSELADIGSVGTLVALEELRIDSCQSLASLPKSMSALSKLRLVSLDSAKTLRDISVLEELDCLSEFSIDSCDELSTSAIKAVKKSVLSKEQTSAPALKMNYEQFIASGHYKELHGKEDGKRSYSFPLCFDTVENLLEYVEDFSWLDDHRDDETDESEILANESGLKPLAILDFGFEGCDTSQIDSYCEEIFLVDTEDPQNPVLIWPHDGAPSQIHPSFDDFLANLHDFSLSENGEGEGDDNSDDEESNRVYLEYVEGKSSKFWQVDVVGTTHTVTYGKIGAKGTTKTKEFSGEDAAQKDAEKLIASKLKKGYERK